MASTKEVKFMYRWRELGSNGVEMEGVKYLKYGNWPNLL